MFANAKKPWDAAHIEITRTLTLKLTRSSVLRLGMSHSDIISASNAAVTAPTDGPNHNVAANTKGSETDKRATSPGIFTVNDPVRTVKAARASHAGEGGVKNRSRRAHPKTHTPARGMSLK